VKHRVFASVQHHARLLFFSKKRGVRVADRPRFIHCSGQMAAANALPNPVGVFHRHKPGAEDWAFEDDYVFLKPDGTVELKWEQTYGRGPNDVGWNFTYHQGTFIINGLGVTLKVSPCDDKFDVGMCYARVLDPADYPISERARCGAPGRVSVLAGASLSVCL
jgi:hypothetical protein